MLDRRGFFGLSLLLLPARAAARSPVRLRRRPPVIWTGALADKPGKGVITARLQDQTRYGTLRARVTPTVVTLLSNANDNRRFLLWVEMPRQPADDWQFLELDGTYFRADSVGYDSTGSQTTFTFDRATAQRAATAFAIPMHERTRLDAGLRYRWSFPATRALTATDPIPVTLHVENAGNTSVGFQLGGRQRGPRDNQFAFRIRRDGAELALKDAPDFGGISTSKPLKPGEKLAVTCADLRAWADFDRAGHYAIDATFEGELQGKQRPGVPERASIWEIRVPGQGAIVVR